MKRIELFFFAVVWLAVLAVVPTARAAATNGAPDFNEVRDLLRSHLPGMTDAELNQAAVEGLVKCLRGRVVLLAEDVKSVPGTNASLLARSTVLEEGVIYLRAGRVADGLAKAVGDTYEQLASSNKINGVVLDLRFANGDDYPAAAATADLFLTKQQRLLDWGMGFVESKRKTNAISVPVAILVNAETGEAAEALAAVLRESGAGLILGRQTAGRAVRMQDFVLKNGQRLQIATTPIKLADGSSLSLNGLKPDIEVAVTAEEERAYFEDAYAVLPKLNLLAGAGLSLTNPPAGTNHLARRRLSEAVLVRERRGDLETNADLSSASETEPEKPVLRDPVLVRALDLLKGLAMVRESHIR